MPTDTVPEDGYRSVVMVAADHPSLPGHFPQRPLVPGVVLLEHVAQALHDWQGCDIARLLQVKFLQPLLPEQTAELVLEQRGARIAFSLARAGAPIASGVLEPGAAAGAASTPSEHGA